MNNADHILKSLRSKSFRITETRKELIRIFCDSQFPLDAACLKEKLEELNIRADRTTIYREIEFLKENGVAQELVFPDSVRRYEIAGRNHHHHLICQRCSAIEDVDIDESFLDKALASTKKKFTVLGHSLEFFGLCAKCR